MEKGETIMDPKIFDLYDEYLHQSLDRRTFLSKLTVLAGSTAAAYALLPLLGRNHANAEIIPKNDSRLHTEYVKYPGETGEVRLTWHGRKRMQNCPVWSSFMQTKA